MNNRNLAAYILVFLVLLLPTAIQAQKDSTSSKQTGYAPVNGQKIYYEIYGEGRPLLLLHGAYMTIGLNWEPLLPELSKGRKVIAIEMQGHGHTADRNRPFSFDSLAADAAAVLQYLKIESADVAGYSLGGTVALQMAIQYPALVKKLVVISSAYSSEGWLPEVREMFKTFKPEFFDFTPLKPAYEKVAPEPGHWHDFVVKMVAFGKEDYNLGEEKIKKIVCPVLLVMGDNDGVSMNHKASFYRLLGGDKSGDVAGIPKSQLSILPGTTHVTLMMQTEKLLPMLKTFLQ